MNAEAIERVEKAIEALRSGRIVILSDEVDRENEGDFVLAAQFATPETINFMAKYGRGLICLPMAPHLIDRLNLPPMVASNESSLGTAFTVSIGSKKGITTGISAWDRAHTIQTAIAENTTRDDLVVPGHVFPLRAREGGVLVRAGHTEGSVDLVTLAGLRPAAVICEILKEDGSMARSADLETFAREHKIPSMTMAELILYRLHKDNSLLRDLGTQNLGHFGKHSLELCRFESSLDQSEHWAFILGDKTKIAQSEVRVRVQKAHPVEDMVHGLDSGKHPFAEIFNKLSQGEMGIFVYLRSEKQSPQFQDSDESGALRQYGVGAQILRRLGVQRMRLLTDHPKTLVGLEGFGIECVGTEGMNS
jgi:3,4-dihydroxy 2-butanone 4-phosphate synthase / GTP cyclohydrolase II